MRFAEEELAIANARIEALAAEVEKVRRLSNFHKSEMLLEREKLERVSKAAAEKDDALQQCNRWAHELVAYDCDFAERNNVNIADIGRAISSDAGKDYVAKSDVKPLVDALRMTLNTFRNTFVEDYTHTIDQAEKALADAKAKGI